MINELFPFQLKAVRELRSRAAMALDNYRRTDVPQVVSLQAPTGSGKTIIIASLMEDIYYGTEEFAEQPEAIFVWLSDSPQLNAQSREKIDRKSDRIRPDQCVTITEDSFDQEVLTDGHIYFLNTQKLSVAGKLGAHSDNRQYTIWETLKNTAERKSDRLYFVIDEAHRGMQGREGGKATSIMQRFIKGSPKHKLPPMPLVIGMSATAARFNALVGDTSSTLNRVIIKPVDVRASGLLKDRIILTYPDDPEKNNDLAVLQAATDEWQNKCRHWLQYTTEQHYAHVNPVFVVQVAAGSGKRVSATNLDDVVAKIEERTRIRFKEGEVVHTFGSTGTLKLNGLDVPHIEASDITENRQIKLVLFKENLSTGWDCPRAETMMSFRHAEDATYIAQLLGRMIRTPLQCHINVDESLNDVRLFLPYFNRDTVKTVIDELQNTEGGDLPTVVDDEALEEQAYTTWSVHIPRKKISEPDPDAPQFPQLNEEFVEYSNNRTSQEPSTQVESDEPSSTDKSPQSADGIQENHPQPSPLPKINVQVKLPDDPEKKPPKETVIAFPLPKVELDRKAVIKFINEQGFLNYQVRDVKINSYLKSLLDLASLLSRENLYRDAIKEVVREVTNMMHEYISGLHESGDYNHMAQQVMEFKLSVQIFDIFGEAVRSRDYANDFVTMSDSDLDRQLRTADAQMGKFGFPNRYGERFGDEDNFNSYKIDCILFAANEHCMTQLSNYAEKKFHTLNDEYRKYIVNKSELCKKQYNDISRNSDAVSKHNLSLPETISVKVDTDGFRYINHLYADENGIAQIKLNSWEAGVLEEEQQRDDFVCWLRNPSRQSWALCMPYEMNGVWKSTYPDFLIIRHDSQLGYVMDILEPHNPDWKDNLPKAKAFARYAESEPQIGRIQLIRMWKDAIGKTRFVRLDMSKGAVRSKVLKAQTNDELDHLFDSDGSF